MIQLPLRGEKLLLFLMYLSNNSVHAPIPDRTSCLKSLNACRKSTTLINKMTILVLRYFLE